MSCIKYDKDKFPEGSIWWVNCLAFNRQYYMQVKRGFHGLNNIDITDKSIWRDTGDFTNCISEIRRATLQEEIWFHHCMEHGYTPMEKFYPTINESYAIF